jgi:hypothetical protein
MDTGNIIGMGFGYPAQAIENEPSVEAVEHEPLDLRSGCRLLSADCGNMKLLKKPEQGTIFSADSIYSSPAVRSVSSTGASVASSSSSSSSSSNSST